MELEQILSENKNYIHASNIRTKLKGKNSVEANDLKKVYETYIQKIKQINHKQSEEKIIAEKVKLLNDYYDAFDKGKFGEVFSSQSKLRSTILEEFLCILFEDLICQKQTELKTNNLKAGGAKAYSNLYFSSENLEQFVASPTIGINQKDQDYAIYRSLNLSVNDEISKEINLPIVSIEAKTYIDKTMLEDLKSATEMALLILILVFYENSPIGFVCSRRRIKHPRKSRFPAVLNFAEGSIAAAEKIKSGNPYAKFSIGQIKTEVFICNSENARKNHCNSMIFSRRQRKKQPN